jgi:glycosyltransferase involved in cell wall biosynthesis
VAGYLSVAKGHAEAVEIFSRSSLRKATLLLVCPDFDPAAMKALTPKQILKGLYHMSRGKGLRGIAFPTQLQLLRRFWRKRNRMHNRQILGVSLSRDETISAFLDANLLLFPSWIECSPLVLFEASAARTPFLITDVGNASEIIRWTGGGRLLPGVRCDDREGSVQADVDAGARCLDDLMADQQAREKMAESAHEAWLRHFTWSRIAEQYEQLYGSLLAGEPIQALFPPPATLR